MTKPNVKSKIRPLSVLNKMLPAAANTMADTIARLRSSKSAISTGPSAAGAR